MNANLTNARKAYFDKVHRIQRDRKCTFAEAKKIYNQNGAPASAPLADLTPDALVNLAQGKADEIFAQITECHERVKDLQADLSRWQKIGKSLDLEPQTEVARGSGWDGPPPNPPKGSYVAVG